MTEILGWILGICIIGAMLAILYDILFRPWRLIEDEVKDAEKRLKLLNGRFARLYAFITAPWLKGDVEKTRKFVSERIKLKEAELELFEKLKAERR